MNYVSTSEGLQTLLPFLDQIDPRPSFSEALGRKRIVVVRGTPLRDRTAALASYDAHREKAPALDLALFSSAADAPRPFRALSPDEEHFLAAYYDLAVVTPRFLLIGKDTRVKFASNETLSFEEVRAMIEAMPVYWREFERLAAG